MSTKYPGGFITKNPVAPTTTAASGIWTLDQATQYIKAGTWPGFPYTITYLVVAGGGGGGGVNTYRGGGGGGAVVLEQAQLL